ncbi:MAG: anti-sigma factor RskA [Marmoricola sp.]|nr:anti-sigma factor RskA [Marmoricola sp.]
MDTDTLRDPITDSIHLLTGAHVVDALDDRLRRSFEAHLRACPTCEGEVADFRETVALLAGSGSVTPPAGVRSRVLRTVPLRGPGWRGRLRGLRGP